MSTDFIIQKLDRIEKMLTENNLQQKEVLNFNEAAIYLEVSHSHLYKLTSTGKVPAYKPNGKKLYFNRLELNEWLLSNRQRTNGEIDNEAQNFQLKPGRS